MGDEKLINITQEAIEMAQKTFEINKSETEPKKRGRTPMTEEEKAKKAEERARKKALEKEQEKENKRLEELGYFPASPSEMENCISIILPKDFLDKCKKEKINKNDYESLVFALLHKYANGEIELKKKIKTEFY